MQVSNFKDYINLYVKDKVDDNNMPLKVVHEEVNPRWEVAVCLSSEKGFQQVSFVNSIATTKVQLTLLAYCAVCSLVSM